MEDEDYVECARCGREISDSEAIYMNGTPFCNECHGEYDFNDEDDDFGEEDY